METITVIAQTIQLAVAPVFLLAGIGAFLNVCAGRLGRVIDRARVVERVVLETVGEERKRMLREIRKLDRRIDFLNNAIFLSVASAILEIGRAQVGTPVTNAKLVCCLLPE